MPALFQVAGLQSPQTAGAKTAVGSHALPPLAAAALPGETQKRAGAMALDETIDPVGMDAVTSQLVQVSRAMIAIYKEQFGRGPERARSYYAGPDCIVCLLEKTLTPVERSLQTMDEHQRLRDIRMLFQYTAEKQFCGAVEEITGRRVVAFISGIDTHADVASEQFIFEPGAS